VKPESICCRIYNPIKNSYEHDGEFIKKWVLELRAIYFTSFVHEPYINNLFRPKFNDFEVEHCPKPIVNMERTRKFASDFLWKNEENPSGKKRRKFTDIKPFNNGRYWR
jgi:deoxyribodipyrimidine photo-lyase